MSSHDRPDPQYEDLVRTLRRAKPEAPQDVRERVQELGEPRAFARFAWRRPILVFAPVAAVAAGLAIGFVALGDRDQRSRPHRTAAAPAARRPARPQAETFRPVLRAGSLSVGLVSSDPPRTVARVHAIVRAAGGTVSSAPRAGVIRLLASVPNSRAAEVLSRFAALGKMVTEPRAARSSAPGPRRTRIVVVVSRG
jgi:hypothetical protein